MEQQEHVLGKVCNKVCEKTNLSKLELLGLILAILAVVVASVPHRYGFLHLRKVSGAPGFLSGLLAFFFTAILYWRGLISFANSNKVGKYMGIIVNVMLFTSMFAIIVSATPRIGKDVMLIITVTACVVSLLCGMKGLAKLITILSLLILTIKSLLNVDEAMGVSGFIFEVLAFSSFYFQGNVNFNGLHDELKILYGKASYTITDTIHEAEPELKKAGEAIKHAAETVVKVGV